MNRDNVTFYILIFILMKRKITNIAIFALATISAIPFVWANLDNITTNSPTSEYIDTSTNNENYYNEYEKYYNEFKKEFYEELSKWDFTKIEEKIKWLLWDIDYLSKNPENENYVNIEKYKIKVQALKDLKENFWYTNNLQNDNLKLQDINSDKIKTEKNEMMRKIEIEKKRLEERIKRKEEFKKIKNTEKEILKEQKKIIKQKRNELKENISQIKNQRQELRKKYKNKFKTILKDRLETMKKTHIETVLSRIEIALEKATNEKIIAQLEALKELLEDRLNTIEEIINLDELLKE